MLVKLLMLQKRVRPILTGCPSGARARADEQIMLFGYPVEMLCNHQYSLVSLIPGQSSWSYHVVSALTWQGC